MEDPWDMGYSVRAAAAASSGVLDSCNVKFAVVAGIKKGNPTVIRTNFNGSHYVLATGYVEKDGLLDIYINDPEGNVKFTKLSQYLAKYGIREWATIG